MGGEEGEREEKEAPRERGEEKGEWGVRGGGGRRGCLARYEDQGALDALPCATG